jgi:hypothetical protein
MSRTAQFRTLAVSIEYEPNLAPAPAERAAFLTLFLSKDVRGEPYARVAVDDTSDTLKRTTTLRVRVDAPLPRDTTLSVCAYVHTRNSHGEATLNQGGFARFYLQDLVAGGAATRAMLVPCAQNYSKGRVTLRVAGADALKFAAATPYDYDERAPESVRRFASAVAAHIAASRHIVDGLPLGRGLETMGAIRAPLYRAYDLTMPGVFFCMVRPDAPSPAAYYENVLDIVLRRHYARLSIDEARSKLATEAPWRDVAIVLAKMLCVFPNYCTYLTDKIVEGHRHGLASYIERTRDRPIESFDVTFRLTLTSDCEDDALASALEALDIEALAFETPAMRRVQQCRRAMECEMALKGVLGGSLHDAMQSGAVRFGGHMNARLTPRALFARRLARVHADGEAPYVGLSGEFRDAAEALAAPLPVLDLEGTGVLEPDCARDENGPLHDYLSRNAPEAAFHRAKFSVQMPRDEEHAFYKYVQSSMLPDRAERGFAALEVTYVQARAGAAVSSAVAYPESRCETRESVALWAGAELSSELRRWAPSVLKHVHPVAPHAAPFTRARDVARNALLERVVAGKTAAAAAAFSPLKAADVPVEWRHIDYMLRDDQLDEQRTRALRRAAEARAVRRVEYFCEPVTPALTGWLLRFWLEPSAM